MTLLHVVPAIDHIPGVPLGLLQLARFLLARPSSTSDHLLTMADALRDYAAHVAIVDPRDVATIAGYRALAEQLRRRAPAFSNVSAPELASCR